MCIIIYGKVKDILENGLYPAWTHNSEGAGIAYETKRGIYYQKGFMNYQEIHKFVTLLKKDRFIALHFRITTHGGTCKELTHPFPICEDFAKMRLLSGTCSGVIFHNGILNYDTDKGTSDSMKLALALHKYPSNILQHTIKLLTGVSDSKYLIWTKEHGAVRAGKNWELHNNVYYSNSTHTLTSYLGGYNFSKSKSDTKYWENEAWRDGARDKKTGKIVPFETSPAFYVASDYETKERNHCEAYDCPRCNHLMDNCYGPYHYCFNCDTSWELRNGFLTEESFQENYYPTKSLNSDDGPAGKLSLVKVL